MMENKEYYYLVW